MMEAVNGGREVLATARAIGVAARYVVVQRERGPWYCVELSFGKIRVVLSEEEVSSLGLVLLELGEHARLSVLRAIAESQRAWHCGCCQRG